jgi:hypothetical protein
MGANNFIERFWKSQLSTRGLNLKYTAKPTQYGTAMDSNVSVADRFRFVEITEISVFGNPHPRDFKRFPQKRGFCYAQVLF